MAQGPVTYKECGIALHSAVTAAGHAIWNENGVWLADDPVAVQAIINGFDPLTQPRADKNAAIGVVFAVKFASGFSYVGSDSVRRTFQLDANSQFAIDVQANVSLGSIMAGEPWDSTSYFIAADNSHMPTSTAISMRNFALAVRSYCSAIILRNRALKDAVIAAKSHADLDAIDPTSGWPVAP